MNYDLDLNKVISKIKENNYKKILIQLADGLKPEAKNIVDTIKKQTNTEVLIYSGHFEEAIRMCEKAMRLHPHAPLYFLGWLLVAYYWVGRYDESLAVAEQHIDKSREAGFTLGVVWGLTGSIMVKVKLDRLSEARHDVHEILKIWPWYNLDFIKSISFYKDPANLEHWIDGLRTAGMPEHPASQ